MPHLNIKTRQMKNSDLIIRVPEPCHEDWNKMTPEAQGKFCGSCCKTVVDFSGKTDQEIKMILVENAGKKMCGHFKKTQVDRPLTQKLELNNLPKNVSVSRAFVAAVFFIFGSFLFNCKAQSNKILGRMSVQRQPVKENTDKFMLKGDVSVETVDEKTVTPITTATTDVAKNEEEQLVNGQMTVTQTPVVQKEKEYTEREFIKGKVSPDYYNQHLIKEEPIKQEPIKEEVLPIETVQELAPEDSTIAIISTEPIINSIPKDSIANLPTITDRDPMLYTVGMMMVIPVEHDTVVPEKIYEPIPETKVEEINVNGMEVSIYPNPGSREFTISYEVKKRADVIANLLDIKGARIKNLITVSQQYEGKYQVGVDAGDLPNGIYFIDLVNGDIRTTKKIVIEK